MKLLRAGVVVLSVVSLAFAACGGSTPAMDASSNDGGGDGSAVGNDGGDNDASALACTADSDCASDETCDVSSGACVPASSGHCHQCACENTQAEGGCADVCNPAVSGTGTPNFCSGVPALSMCASCLHMNCADVADPNDPVSCQ